MNFKNKVCPKDSDRLFRTIKKEISDDCYIDVVSHSLFNGRIV